MSDDQDKPARRPRSRKLRPGVAAFGVLLAVGVMLFLVSGRPSEDSVEIRFLRTATNAENNLVAWFSVSNAGPRAVLTTTIATETKAPTFWPSYHRAHRSPNALKPGQMWEVDLYIPREGQMCRGRVEWFEPQSRLEKYQTLFRDALDRILNKTSFGGRPWRYQNENTNHSSEFTR